MLRMRSRSIVPRNLAKLPGDVAVLSRSEIEHAGLLRVSNYHNGVTDMPTGELGGHKRRRDKQAGSTSTHAATIAERREHQQLAEGQGARML